MRGQPLMSAMVALRTSLNVSLIPELKWFITARAASVRHQTATEVVRPPHLPERA